MDCRIKRIGSVSLISLSFIFASSARADSHGEFPGKGNQGDYKKSCDFIVAGVGFANNKEMERAIASFRQAISIYPFDSASHHNLGKALRKTGQFKEAIVEYKKALDLEPSYLSAWLGLGNSFGSLNNLPEAEKCYRKSVQLKPNSYETNGDLGECLRDQGKFKEARIFLLKAKACAKVDNLPEIETALKLCDERERDGNRKEAAH